MFHALTVKQHLYVYMFEINFCAIRHQKIFYYFVYFYELFLFLFWVFFLGNRMQQFLSSIMLRKSQTFKCKRALQFCFLYIRTHTYKDVHPPSHFLGPWCHFLASQKLSSCRLFNGHNCVYFQFCLLFSKSQSTFRQEKKRTFKMGSLTFVDKGKIPASLKP